MRQRRQHDASSGAAVRLPRWEVRAAVLHDLSGLHAGMCFAAGQAAHCSRRCCGMVVMLKGVTVGQRAGSGSATCGGNGSRPVRRVRLVRRALSLSRLRRFAAGQLQQLGRLARPLPGPRPCRGASGHRLPPQGLHAECTWLPHCAGCSSQAVSRACRIIVVSKGMAVGLLMAWRQPMQVVVAQSKAHVVLAECIT